MTGPYHCNIALTVEHISKWLKFICYEKYLLCKILFIKI